MEQTGVAFAPAMYLSRDPAVHEQRMGGEVLLYHQARGQVGILNHMAYFIWQRCDGKHAAGDIAAAIAHSFAGTETFDLHAQVWETLRMLQAGGLVAVAEKHEGNDTEHTDHAA